ncbi:MAG: hypothetical protein QM767_11590 [Anaeromyxobacter sp.]
MNLKDGPGLERARSAIRAALMTQGPAAGGTLIGGLLHCASLVGIGAKAERGVPALQGHVEPEFPAVYFAQVAVYAEHLVEALTAELDLAEKDIAARRSARRAA